MKIIQMSFGNLSEVITAISTLLGAAATAWITFLVYRWAKAIDKLQHIRLVDELWQTLMLHLLKVSTSPS